MTTGESVPIRKILVATDFSETAEAGLDWAMELAATHDATIHLVHGLLFPNRAAGYLPSPGDMSNELTAAALKRLDETAARVRGRGLEVRSQLEPGLPSESILAVAAQLPADIIVIGTRGLTGVRHLMLGSTAERVVQQATCPVITVHPGDVDKHRQVRTILVPTDFSSDAELAIETALGLLRRQPDETRLVLLHAYHLPFEYTAYGAIPTSLDYLADVEGAALERLQESAARLAEAGVTVEVLAKEGYPPEVVVAEADGIGADLIAMGIQGRSGLAHLVLGSTAERVVQHAGCPVLTVRRRDE